MDTEFIIVDNLQKDHEFRAIKNLLNENCNRHQEIRNLAILDIVEFIIHCFSKKSYVKQYIFANYFTIYEARNYKVGSEKEYNSSIYSNGTNTGIFECPDGWYEITKNNDLLQELLHELNKKLKLLGTIIEFYDIQITNPLHPEDNSRSLYYRNIF
jgi:hypothetical protein